MITPTEVIHCKLISNYTTEQHVGYVFIMLYTLHVLQPITPSGAHGYQLFCTPAWWFSMLMNL